VKNRIAVFGFIGIIAACAMLGCFGSPAEKAAQLKEQAQTYYEQGRYQEASIEYQAALQHDATNADAMYGLAKCLYKMGEYLEYKKTLVRVMKIDPVHAGAGAALGNLYWAAGRYNDALELAKKILNSNNNLPALKKLEARSLAALGRLDEARTAWAEVLDAEADEQAYIEAASFEAYLGNVDEARARIKAGLEKSPKSVSLLLGLADLESLTGSFEAAETALLQAEELNSEDVKVLLARAKVLVRKNKVDEALAGLDAAQARFTEDSAKSIEFALGRSDLLMSLGAIEDARAVLKAELERNPEDPELSAAMANILLLSGDTDAARQYLPSAKEASESPRTKGVTLLEARLYLLEGRSNWALAVLENLAASGDMSVDVQFLYAKALAQEGKWAKARDIYSRILKRVPDHFFARLDMAELLEVQHYYDEAVETLKEIKLPWRSHPRVQLLLARILLEKGDVSQARKLAELFLKKAPESISVLLLIGDVEKASKHPEKAMAHYVKAAELAPKATAPIFSIAQLYESQGELKKAIAALEEHLKNTESPMAYNRLADLQIKDGALGGALGSLDRSIIIEPNYWFSRLLRARVFLVSKEESKAILELEETIRLNPDRPEAYNLLADIYIKKGNPARAEEEYKRLLDRNSGEPVTCNNLASLYLEQGRIDEALKYASASFAGAPNSGPTLDTLGWAYKLAGQHKKADFFLTKAKSLLPGEPAILFHWAVNKLDLEARAEAKKALEAVVAAAPGTKEANEAAKLLSSEFKRK